VKAVELRRRPSIEDYVKTLATKVSLPVLVVKTAVDILERNRRFLSGKISVGFCGGFVAGVV
jgi:tetrahydromethanopterin S-methyltransferase subunit F